MGGSTLEVTNLPPDINDADFHHLFSLSGCLGSRLERDGGGRPVGYLSFADEPAAMTARNYYNDTTSYRLEVMINQPNRGPPPNQAPVDEDRGGKRMRNDGGYDGGGFGYQAGPPGPGPGSMPPPRLPDNASPTLHVSGVPKDATVREICHIFRPFDGFQSARLVPSKDPERGPLCFAEFTNPELAFVALETLEGYLIDRDDPDSSALHIAFAKNKPSGRMARK